MCITHHNGFSKTVEWHSPPCSPQQPFHSCLGQLSDAVSATGHFGDGGRKCFIRKTCVFEIQ